MNKIFYGEYPINYWVELLMSKKIILPEYQRHFVWKESRILKLLDSLKNDLFIPPVTIAYYTDEEGDRDLIIDGQQRLTSILLNYIGVCPPEVNKQAVRNDIIAKNADENNEIIQFADPNDDLIEEDLIKKFDDWRFENLLKLGSDRESIRIAALRQGYSDLNIDSEEIDEIYRKRSLGFSYIIPDLTKKNIDSKTIQKNYYSSVFKNINTGGVSLLPQEARAALYFLDGSKTKLFMPDFSRDIKISTAGNNKPGKPIDFVRYLSIVSEYATKTTFDSGFVARGIGRNNFEEYYNDFISQVIGKYPSITPGESTEFKNKDKNETIENSSENKQQRQFEIDAICENDRWIERSKLFEKSIKAIAHNLEFDSIIDADMYIFGLLYYCYFTDFDINKIIERENGISELVQILDGRISALKQSENPEYPGYLHTKNPNALKYLRCRLQYSTEIYYDALTEGGGSE